MTGQVSPGFGLISRGFLYYGDIHILSDQCYRVDSVRSYTTRTDDRCPNQSFKTKLKKLYEPNYNIVVR